MENQQIWLKPKPTHIDENFEDFLDYLKNSESTFDVLHQESLRLLKLRVSQLIEERFVTPIYRQNKEPETLKFSVRLCGAWLLSFKDAAQQERKQVLLTMINCLLHLCLLSDNKSTLAYRSVSTLAKMAISLVTNNVPEVFSFSWKDLLYLTSLDQFLNNFLEMSIGSQSDGFYEENGLMITAGDKIILADYSKYLFDTKYHSKSSTKLLSDHEIFVSSGKDSKIKDSQKDDIGIVEKFFNEILSNMRVIQKPNSDDRLLHYSDGEYVPVEITEITPQKILVKTIDPNYAQIAGQLIFEQNLQIFSKIYPIDVWAKVLKVGDRLNVNIINTESRTFSITKLFVDFITDNVCIGDDFDANNWKGTGDCLDNREFWTNEGFMVYVTLSEQEDAELDLYNRYAGIEITGFGEKQYRGCLYGRIYDYEAETRNISREEARRKLLKEFLEEHSKIEIEDSGADYIHYGKEFVKEICVTLNIMQGREVNPMTRYKELNIIRILCTLIDSECDDKYCEYIAKYIKTLILFAKADNNEGDVIKPFNAPDDLKDEETVRDGEDILKILSCFSKKYEETNDILVKYIEGDKVSLRQTASLVQSYNRLRTLLDTKPLRGIKKQILNQLSVVTDGDSTLELTSELEGIFGEEDDMKEFKTSFFEAPSNAKEQLQSHNIFRGICAMMNSNGGVLFLGVNDKGIPVGVKNDLEYLSRKYNRSASLDSYMQYISKEGEDWFGETYWKYVKLKPMSEYNVVCINIEPYPYDIVYLKDGNTYLRKNNSSAPITDEATINDIRRRRQENLRKADDKVIIIQDAISKKRRVRLIGYKSSNSGTIKNRIVEAFRVDDNEFIHCYEIKADKVKLFRISRAERIVMSDEQWEFEDKHQELSIDSFHMSGETKINVKLRLKLQAKNAMEEQYPKTSPSIKQYDRDTWTLETYTYNLIPLMEFYLSHAKYMEIVDVKGLKETVLDYVKQYILKE